MDDGIPLVRAGGDVASPRTHSRDQLLDSVRRLITERNSLSFSLSEAAAHAGVNSALVKYYFGNKGGMMLALLDATLAPRLVEMEQLLEVNLPPARKMRIHLEGMMRTYFRYPFINRLVQSLMRENPQNAALVHRKYVMPVVDFYAALLKDGFDKGVFREVDPVFFYISTTGICDQFFTGRDSLALCVKSDEIGESHRSAYTRHICSLVLDGIAGAQCKPKP